MTIHITPNSNRLTLHSKWNVAFKHTFRSGFNVRNLRHLIRICAELTIRLNYFFKNIAAELFVKLFSMARLN